MRRFNPLESAGAPPAPATQRNWILPSMGVLASFVLIGFWSCAPISPSYVKPAGADNILHNGSDYKLAAIEFGELGSYAESVPARTPKHDPVVGESKPAAPRRLHPRMAEQCDLG